MYNVMVSKQLLKQILCYLQYKTLSRCYRKTGCFGDVSATLLRIRQHHIDPLLIIFPITIHLIVFIPYLYCRD